MIAPFTCNRCKQAMLSTESGPEVCWYCLADLCYACWNEIGHCGHAEAEAENERCRQRQTDPTESVLSKTQEAQ